MSIQSGLYDAEEGKLLKEAGIRRAALGRGDLLELAQTIARQHAKLHGRVHIENVLAELIRRGYPSTCLGNGSAAIWRNPHWVCVGQHVCEMPVKHGRRVGLYEWHG